MKNVLITGGSRGIGRAMVEAFSDAGYRVYFLYQKNDEAAKIVETQTGAIGIKADVRDPMAVRASFARMESECGGVDVLINNAAVSSFSLLQDVSEEVIENISTAYTENSPDFLYFITLYNIFNEFLEDISEDVLPNESTGFKDSKIWSMLYNFQKDAVLAIINKLENARNNLSAPDYTILINAINNTNIPEERMHNFELFSKKTYEDAFAKAKAALTSRSQVAINLAAEVLQAAYRNLNPTTPAYIIVIPAEIPTETQQIVSVMTSEFHDGCSLYVTVSYDYVMEDGVEDTIGYKLKKDGNTDIISDDTKILQFGKAESATKSTTISVGDLDFSNPNVAGTYTDKATFKVSV